MAFNLKIQPLAIVSKTAIEMNPLAPGAHHIIIRPFTSNTTQVEWKSYGMIDQKDFPSFYNFVMWLYRYGTVFKVEYRRPSTSIYPHKNMVYCFVYFYAALPDLNMWLGDKNKNHVCVAAIALDSSFSHTPFYVNQLLADTKEMIVCNLLRERETHIQRILEEESTIIKDIPPQLKASRYLHLAEQESVKLFE